MEDFKPNIGRNYPKPIEIKVNQIQPKHTARFLKDR